MRYRVKAHFNCLDDYQSNQQYNERHSGRVIHVANLAACRPYLRHFIMLRPLAGYGLPPPPRGNFVDHIFLKAQCLTRILQHVSPLTMAALSCNSLLLTLPYKIFGIKIIFKTSEKCKR